MDESARQNGKLCFMQRRNDCSARGVEIFKINSANHNFYHPIMRTGGSTQAYLAGGRALLRVRGRNDHIHEDICGEACLKFYGPDKSGPCT